MGKKKSGSRSGMNNRDHISEILETIFWIKYLILSCGTGILNGKKSDSRSGMEKFGCGIWDQQLGSVTLVKSWIRIRITVMWIRNPGWNQCCGSGMFIPDPTFFHPGSEFFHPGSTKNLSILTQKNGFQAL